MSAIKVSIILALLGTSAVRVQAESVRVPLESQFANTPGLFRRPSD
jgi:hypothetical protein